MIWTERRNSPRIPLKELAYLNLEPGNGGIILNISEGGICFQAAVPLQPAPSIHLWFSHGSSRIEADGRLAWTDETRKRGGLLFTNLSAPARKELRHWISQLAPPVTVHSRIASALPSPLAPPHFPAKRRDTTSPPRRATTLAAPTTLIQPPRILTGFAGGLVAGVLISTLVTGLVVLQTHRRELGESLIRLGERLGGNTVSQEAAPQTQADSSQPLQASPTPQTVAEVQPLSAAPSPVSQQQKLLSSPPAAPVQPTAVKPTPATPSPTTARPAALLSVQAKLAGTPAASSPTAPQPSALATAPAPTSDPTPDLPRPLIPQLEPPNPPGVHIESSKESGASSPAEKFLEVGRFNEKLWADNTTSKLSQFGFPVKIVSKNRLWKKSYQVLVGPYSTDPQAEAVHKNLVSHGFAPRSFERGTRDFRLPRVLRLGNSSMPVGDCTISWESYIPDAIVKFQTHSGLDFVAEAKWVNRNVRYVENAVVYTTNRDGSRTLAEIRFSGMGRALVFGSGNI